MKAQFVIDLLKSNANRFTPAQLEAATGTARRARRALFLARRDFGIKLEAIRDAGRTVTAYVCNDSALPTVATPAKASKAASAKSVAKAKPAKEVVAKAKPKVRVTKAMQKAVAADVAKSDAEVAAIKEANLATMRAVSAKNAKVDAKSRLTDEQKAIREEFYAAEALAEARFEERAALRNNAPAFLFKESYSE